MKGEKTEVNSKLTEKEYIVELANTFEFISTETIRIKGTRVGIEVVIEKFLEGARPEEIQRHHPHLTLKQIYATITYYLFNQEQIDAYIKAGRKRVEAAYEEQRKNPSLGVKRLMKIMVNSENK
ncbi:MAG: DUF433 domain-containing protein [Proteobacteria bacterium]|nr:DUF433 domain-containing protein [Pseudomonadota bacterium]